MSVKVSDDTLDHVIQRAVGLDAHQEPRAIDCAHLMLTGHQGIEHALCVDDQVIAFDVGLDVAQRPPHIRGDQAISVHGLPGEAADDQVLVEKDGADIDVVEQILHVILHAGQLLDLGLQFGVDRHQFFIDGLQFLFGGFQFFIGGLQFFVGGLQFLVGRFEFFIRGLLFFYRGLQILFRIGQFALQGLDAPEFARPAGALAASGLDGD